MLETVKRTMYAGLGLAMLTKEKADDFIRYLVETGEMSQLQAEEFVEDLRHQGQQMDKRIQDKVDAAIQSTVERLNLATKEDIYRLNLKLDELLARSAATTPLGTATVDPAVDPVTGTSQRTC